MGDGLEVRGGSGGVAARHADMRLYADLLDRYGSDLAAIAARATGISVDDNLLSCAVLAPGSAAEVQGRLLGATLGAGGLLALAVRLEARALLLRTKATLIEIADAGGAFVKQKTTEIGATALGTAAPLLAPAAVVGAAATGVFVYGKALAKENGKSLAAFVAGDLSVSELRDSLGDNVGDAGQESLTDVQRFLLDRPGITDRAVVGLPYFVNGLLGPAGVLVPDDYEGFLGLVIGLGNSTGRFLDPAINVSPQATEPVPVETPTLAEVMASSNLNHNAAKNDPDGTQVRIVTVVQGGITRYIVQLPGTQQWDPQSGLDPSDLTTNLEASDDGRSAMATAVIKAMSGIPDGAEVMLMGHSQGGILAANLAGRDELGRVQVRGVLTYGSPVGRIDIPPGVKVLSLEHDQDPVPRSEGTDNPDTVDRTTVYRSLTMKEMDDLTDKRPVGVIDAHSSTLYVETMKRIELAAAAGDPGLAQAVADFDGFFGTDTTSSYQDRVLSRGPLP